MDPTKPTVNLKTKYPPLTTSVGAISAKLMKTFRGWTWRERIPQQLKYYESIIVSFDKTPYRNGETPLRVELLNEYKETKCSRRNWNRSHKTRIYQLRTWTHFLTSEPLWRSNEIEGNSKVQRVVITESPRRSFIRRIKYWSKCRLVTTSEQRYQRDEETKATDAKEKQIICTLSIYPENQM